jgi:predicted DNA-binding transcriptional regulator YafY
VEFRIEEYYSDDWILKRQRSGPLTTVELEGEPWTLALLADHWYLRYCIGEQAPGRLTLQVDPRGLTELPAILLPHGTKLRVIAPDSLRQALIDLAEEWLAHHRQESAED